MALLLLGLVGLLVTGDDGGEETTTPTTAPAQEAPGPAATPQGPVTDACGLVSVEGVASAVGLAPANVRPQGRTFPDPSLVGGACNFVETTDGFVVFVVTVQQAADVQQAQAIGGAGGKRIEGLGDVAVFEQRSVRSRITVAKGLRQVQLTSQRKVVGEDAMVGLARQAVSRI